MTEPYLFRLGARLSRGLETMPPERRAAHRDFLLKQQNPDGGFAGRLVAGETDDEDFESSRDSDLYYTGFGVRALAVLGEFRREDADRVAHYLRLVRHKQTSVIDVVSWLYSALMVQVAGGEDLMADALADWPAQLAATLEEFRTDDGGYAKTREGAAGSTYHTFLVALCYELIGREIPDTDRIVEFINSRRREDGGFVEIGPMKRSGTNPTAAAVAVLQIFSALDDATRSAVESFLKAVRSDGGFQANDRVPFPDSLSTFTGYLTCLDLGLTDVLKPARIARFLRELELKHGGYRAAAWDNAADVEYTFYGLGLTALMNSAPL